MVATDIYDLFWKNIVERKDWKAYGKVTHFSIIPGYFFLHSNNSQRKEKICFRILCIEILSIEKALVSTAATKMKRTGALRLSEIQFREKRFLPFMDKWKS